MFCAVQRLPIVVFFALALQASGWAEETVPNSLTDAEKNDGFKLLFDGKSLEGWVGGVKGYAVKDGAIQCLPSGGGNLYTANEYGDFILRLEFRLTPGANNGLGIRAPLAGDAAYVGMELQVLDDTAPQYKNLKPYQYHGSIYGVVAAEKGHQKPVGEWNQQEVVCQGNHVKVVLNGHTIVDADIKAASTPKTLDGRNHPGLERTTGHIGFLGHGSLVEYRSLRIKDLSPEKQDGKNSGK